MHTQQRFDDAVLHRHLSVRERHQTVYPREGLGSDSGSRDRSSRTREEYHCSEEEGGPKVGEGVDVVGDKIAKGGEDGRG